MKATIARAGLILALLFTASACSPTQPSPASTAAAPSSPTTTDHGSIALAAVTPAPGGELTAGQTTFSATFSVTFDTAVANASLEVQLLDATGQVCGAGASDSQNLVARQATTFTTAVSSVSCSAPASIEHLTAALVGLVSSQRTEYLTGTFAAHYALKAPAPAALSLSGAVTESAGVPLAGAQILVEDGANLGKSTTTDAGGRYVLNGLGAGSFMVRASKDGYDNSHQRVTLAAASVTQDFNMTRPAAAPVPAPGVIRFLSSDPAPGGETVLTEDGAGVYLRDLKIRLAVQVDSTLPDAKLELDLYSDAGQQCAFAFVDQPIVANQPVNVTVNTVWVWQMQTCRTFPAAADTLKITLLTLREPAINNRLQRTDYATVSLPFHYTIRRYPLPPSGAPPAAPAIAELRWAVALPVGGDPPISGDPVSIHCTARESDGAPLTTTITVTWDGLAPVRSTMAFPAGASSSPSGAYFGIGVVGPNSVSALHAKLVCDVTNDRGQTATASGDIGYPK